MLKLSAKLITSTSLLIRALPCDATASHEASYRADKNYYVPNQVRATLYEFSQHCTVHARCEFSDDQVLVRMQMVFFLLLLFYLFAFSTPREWHI